ncbi:hypothetical protein V6N13_142170 [Hibiscus sabdariffa]
MHSSTKALRTSNVRPPDNLAPPVDPPLSDQVRRLPLMICRRLSEERSGSRLLRWMCQRAWRLMITHHFFPIVKRGLMALRKRLMQSRLGRQVVSDPVPSLDDMSTAESRGEHVSDVSASVLKVSENEVYEPWMIPNTRRR